MPPCALRHVQRDGQRRYLGIRCCGCLFLRTLARQVDGDVFLAGHGLGLGQQALVCGLLLAQAIVLQEQFDAQAEYE
jgi:hypothetical protein